MPKRAIATILLGITLFAAGPATRPIETLDDVEANYQARAVAAKRAFDDEMAAAGEQRVAGLRILLNRAMQAQDLDQAIAIKKKIEEAESDLATFDVKKHRKIVYLCEKSGAMLSVFGALKQQLKDSINQVDADQEFNVVFFSDEGADSLFKGGMRAATDDNKKLMMDFVDNEVASGGVLPLPAIKLALAEKPEVLYLFTDGFDSVDNAATCQGAVSAFKKWNPDGKIKINCIFLQSDEDPKLEQVVRQIAADGHGAFKKISKSDM